jgi:hypothetical protein
MSLTGFKSVHTRLLLLREIRCARATSEISSSISTNRHAYSMLTLSFAGDGHPLFSRLSGNPLQRGI